jgi:hypothetical protein
MKRARDDADAAQATLRAELDSANQKMRDAAAREADVLRKQRELEAREANVALDIERTLAAERAKARAEAERLAEERMQLLLKQGIEEAHREAAGRTERMERELAEARAREEASNGKETDLLRRERELASSLSAIALETEKRMLEERKRIQEETANQATQRIAIIQEQTQLREKEHEEKAAQLQKKFDQLQQQLTQGAQQAQGEAQESLLKDILVDAFPEDRIEDVAKGVRGADLVEHVYTPTHEECGVILWESKRTKEWSKAWLDKLRDDQREVGASSTVIVTQTLPPEVKDFGLVEGIWVCGWRYASALAAVLRSGLIDLHQARRASEGRDTKMHHLYDYLTGHEFRLRVEGVIRALVAMQQELESEQRALTRIWRKRGATMTRALGQMSSVYGALQGIVGAKLEDIDALALPAPSSAPLLSDGTAPDSEGSDDADDNYLGTAVASPELERALLALVPADGSAVGNLTLRSALATKVSCSDDEFQAAKRALVARGCLRKGKGRGGSVSRVVDVSAAE